MPCCKKDKYELMKKNTVPSENQLKVGETVFVDFPEGKGKRVMFVGNSITLHGVKEDIGWFNRCGMAASSLDKDYVHVVMSKVLEKDSDASFCICQAAGWERAYKDGMAAMEKYVAARDFEADVIIMRIIENCRGSEYEPEIFFEQYGEFINYLNKTGKAKVILTTGFWKHPGDKEIMAVGEKYGYPTIYLGDLGEDDAMMAKDLYEHKGVGMHPGDKGMENIAERIWTQLEKEFN